MITNNSLNRPWSTQMEMTFGCDNRCPMCYHQVLDKPMGEYNFMSLKTAQEISKKMEQAGWNGIRLEFAMRGEPLLNPHFNRIIHTFRKNLDKSHITVSTNGNNLNPQKAIEYFKAGGNVFVVDCYDGNIEERRQKYEKEGFRVTDYYKDDFNPYARNNINKTHVLCLMDDIKYNSNKKRTRILHNMAGNVDFNRTKYYGLTPLKEPILRKCVKPFREIIFLHDGTIPLCCQDGEINQQLGNIYRIQDLNQFWKKNVKLNILRTLLYNKRRDLISPCKYCDSSGGMRIGFLPKMKILDETTLKQLSSYLVQ